MFAHVKLNTYISYVGNMLYCCFSATPKEDPMINGFREGIWVPNGTLELNCTSGKSFPASNLTWLVKGEEVSTLFVIRIIWHFAAGTSTLGVFFLLVRELAKLFRCANSPTSMGCFISRKIRWKNGDPPLSHAPPPQSWPTLAVRPKTDFIVETWAWANSIAVKEQTKHYNW